MKTLIVIPARYGSSRFPGKPLCMIAGKTLLARTASVAQKTCCNNSSLSFVVATEDERVVQHAKDLDLPCVLTSERCKTGTDRVLDAVQKTNADVDFVINLQGDAPFTPPSFLQALIESFQYESCDVVTPVENLSWEALDNLRASKEKTPFSGTTVVFHQQTGQVHWFSKNIIPALRHEEEMRKTQNNSPVWRHVGLYGYSRACLARFVALPEGFYETLEGLEQLRLLEHGHHIRCVPVQADERRPRMSGIDSPEDVRRAEELIEQYGDPFDLSF
ncbi:MAG: 3-deoxy-manno-octulosonate cytidylyltransferase [Alphaproteobacteria bacterium]|nr:3-deoxy-manno-octulosonate cytidylyltransferase [Alphaproteobacteria bacterium]